jgi:hypothetical protein
MGVSGLAALAHGILNVRSRIIGKTENLALFTVGTKGDRTASWNYQEVHDEANRLFGASQTLLTSATTRAGIDELMTSLISAVDWSSTPGIESSETFDSLYDWFCETAKSGILLMNRKALFELFKGTFESATSRLADVFQESLPLLQNLGVIRFCEWGDSILLVPAFFDLYGRPGHSSPTAAKPGGCARRR